MALMEATEKTLAELRRQRAEMERQAAAVAS
jgi:hypothetical protein